MKNRLQMIRQETGSSMILSLVFLLFCLFLGSSVLAAASANAGRRSMTEQAWQDQRNGLILLKEHLETEEGVCLQITVRDVTVESPDGDRKRTVRYYAAGADCHIPDLLIAWITIRYEAETGLPDQRKLLHNGKNRTLPKTADMPEGSLTMVLDVPVPDIRETLEGGYCFTQDGSLAVWLGETRLPRLMLQAGKSESVWHTIVYNQTTTTTKTTVYYWENPVIEKGAKENAES